MNEKVILKQLSDYIERTSIYDSTQSGFRKGHSTQNILLKFRDDIQQALNKKKRNDKHFNNRCDSLFFLMGIFLKHLRLIPNILY